MSQAPRRRGRPKGSKNKKLNLSGATIEQYCEHYKHNPAEFLITVAKGEHVSFPDPADWMRANNKLFDAIYNKKAVSGGEQGEALDGQFELVFVEDSASFTLPGAANAEGIADTVRAEPVQCIGDSSTGWEDSLCD